MKLALLDQREGADENDPQTVAIWCEEFGNGGGEEQQRHKKNYKNEIC
jgi:hypothetical protein